MGHLGHRRIGLVDGVQHRVAEEPGDQLVHPVVQRRRKQQPLAIIGRGGQNPGDAGQKAEIGHVVRLVDHGDPHRLQGDQTLSHQILEPAGAGHHDVHSGLQRGHLAVLRDAAEDRTDPQASRRRQRLERRGDLRRQLPGGCQHQPRWPGGTAVSGGQPADERNREGERLAAAGFPAAQHISPGKGVGQGFGLDGERARDTARRQRIHDPGGHAEIGKSLGVVTFRCLSGSAGWETRTSRGPARGGEIAGWQNRSPRDKPVRDARIIRVPGAVYGAGTGGMRNFPRRVGGSCQCS